MNYLEYIEIMLDTIKQPHLDLESGFNQVLNGYANNKDNIDFSTVESKYAYVYKFALIRSLLMYTALKYSYKNSIEELFSQEELNLTCFGSGPGCEITGLLTYCQENKIEKNFNFFFLDNEASWEITLQVFKNQIFTYFDIKDIDQIDSNKDFMKSNIFVLNYFLSTVLLIYKNGGENVITNLFKLLKMIQYNSYLILINPRNKEIQKWVNSNLNLIFEFKCVKPIDINYFSFKNIWKTSYERIIANNNKYRPKIESKSIYMLLKRRDFELLSINLEEHKINLSDIEEVLDTYLSTDELVKSKIMDFLPIEFNSFFKEKYNNTILSTFTIHSINTDPATYDLQQALKANNLLSLSFSTDLEIRSRIYINHLSNNINEEDIDFIDQNSCWMDEVDVYVTFFFNVDFYKKNLKEITNFEIYYFEVFDYDVEPDRIYN